MNAPTSSQTQSHLLKTAMVSHAVLFFILFVFAVFCGLNGGNPGLWFFVILANAMLVYILREASEWPAVLTSVFLLAGSCFAWVGTLLSLKYDFSTTNIGWPLACVGIAFLIRTAGYIKTANTAAVMCGTWFTASAMNRTVGANTGGYWFEIILWLVVAHCWLQGSRVKPQMAQVGVICSLTPVSYFVGLLAQRLLST